MSDEDRIGVLEKALEDIIECFDTGGDVFYFAETESGDMVEVNEEAGARIEDALVALYDNDGTLDDEFDREDS